VNLPATRFSTSRGGGGRFDAPSTGFGITRRTFEEIEDFIQDNINSAAKFHYGMDVLVQLLAYTTREYARQKSGGPIAPNWKSNPALAFRIPVQRISGRYYAGWMVKRIANAHWLTYNDAREAWLIETGQFMRVRRPIAKLSALDTLRMIQTTRTADRFIGWALQPRRNARGQFRLRATS
jgi:hypothetical protein